MKTIAIIGAGSRSLHLAKIIHSGGHAKITAVCDTNQTRLDYFIKSLGGGIKKYADFDAMLDEVKPDIAMVTTVDKYHHEYIVKALDKGFDVLSEKPITIDEEKCMLIREAEKRSGKKVTVTFNCRFMPPLIKLKQLVAEGLIGRPLAVNYEYFLNKTHGGDYFKRWHRLMENSGGMLVHKSTHHFDIANWIIGDEPQFVTAFGNRIYYGQESKKFGERCSECGAPQKCPSFEDSKGSEERVGLYFNAEHEDGYLRDRCAFDGDTDIYDNMSVSVRYAGGALLTYSLNLFSSYEGYKISVTGEKGRIEISEPAKEQGIWLPYHKLRLIISTEEEQDFDVPKESGGHGGADERMISMLLGGGEEDPLCQRADSFEGFKSALIGICANKSIKENKAIDLSQYINAVR
jgi:predicted dehydrogenase